MKKRLDIYLVEHNLAPSRQKAQRIIMSGCVYVDNCKTDKSGFLVTDNSVVDVRADESKYVSRGGQKLEKAMQFFDIDITNCVCMDVGASTGGFTDCMLQNGAEKVYSVDVGYGQLAWQLRNDKRVVNLERQNIRYLTSQEVAEKLDFVSIDVSFISLKLVLPVVYNMMQNNATAVALIKPQFEAGREKVGKNGVVKDADTHIEVIVKVFGFTRDIGFNIYGLTYSPIKGPKGNIEYLMHIGKSSNDNTVDIKEVVDLAHREC
ncbi:MAG: TlyA family RNA methyltransferase [Clostridiaceae bacterium]|nr:TlyA family RNA methyltransferase [Clostridiaceae bacterium]